jgi:hypothetical protein
MDQPANGRPPRKVLSLCRTITEGVDGVTEALEIAEELHGELGVWITRLRRDRDDWARRLHRQL